MQLLERLLEGEAQDATEPVGKRDPWLRVQSTMDAPANSRGKETPGRGDRLVNSVVRAEDGIRRLRPVGEGSAELGEML